jgi:hypothetical protein
LRDKNPDTEVGDREKILRTEEPIDEKRRKKIEHSMKVFKGRWRKKEVFV